MSTFLSNLPVPDPEFFLKPQPSYGDCLEYPLTDSQQRSMEICAQVRAEVETFLNSGLPIKIEITSPTIPKRKRVFAGYPNALAEQHGRFDCSYPRPPKRGSPIRSFSSSGNARNCTCAPVYNIIFNNSRRTAVLHQHPDWSYREASQEPSGGRSRRRQKEGFLSSMASSSSRRDRALKLPTKATNIQNFVRSEEMKMLTRDKPYFTQVCQQDSSKVFVDDKGQDKNFSWESKTLELSRLPDIQAIGPSLSTTQALPSEQVSRWQKDQLSTGIRPGCQLKDLPPAKGAPSSCSLTEQASTEATLFPTEPPSTSISDLPPSDQSTFIFEPDQIENTQNSAGGLPLQSEKPPHAERELNYLSKEMDNQEHFSHFNMWSSQAHHQASGDPAPVSFPWGSISQADFEAWLLVERNFNLQFPSQEAEARAFELESRIRAWKGQFINSNLQQELQGPVGPQPFSHQVPSDYLRRQPQPFQQRRGQSPTLPQGKADWAEAELMTMTAVGRRNVYERPSGSAFENPELSHAPSQSVPDAAPADLPADSFLRPEAPKGGKACLNAEKEALPEGSSAKAQDNRHKDQLAIFEQEPYGPDFWPKLEGGPLVSFGEKRVPRPVAEDCFPICSQRTEITSSRKPSADHYSNLNESVPQPSQAPAGLIKNQSLLKKRSISPAEDDPAPLKRQKVAGPSGRASSRIPPYNSKSSSSSVPKQSEQEMTDPITNRRRARTLQTNLTRQPLVEAAVKAESMDQDLVIDSFDDLDSALEVASLHPTPKRGDRASKTCRPTKKESQILNKGPHLEITLKSPLLPTIKEEDRTSDADSSPTSSGDKRSLEDRSPKAKESQVQCGNDAIIFSPTPQHLKTQFSTEAITCDQDFVKHLGEYLQTDKQFKVVLQPEGASKGETQTRFLPKDYFKNFLIRRMKDFALDLGFQIKMPYADRVDKSSSIRTVNFYCHMSKSANRKCQGNDCPFRAVFKIHMGVLKEQRDRWVAADPEKNSLASLICPDRGQEQTKSLLKIIKWEEIIEVHKLYWVHNHHMINYKTNKIARYAPSANLPLVQQFIKEQVLTGMASTEMPTEITELKDADTAVGANSSTAANKPMIKDEPLDELADRPNGSIFEADSVSASERPSNQMFVSIDPYRDDSQDFRDFIDREMMKNLSSMYRQLWNKQTGVKTKIYAPKLDRMGGEDAGPSRRRSSRRVIKWTRQIKGEN